MNPFFGVKCHRVLLFRALLIGLFLYSCSEREITPVEPGHETPLPDMPCGNIVVHGYCNKISFLPNERVSVFINGTVTAECALTIYTLKGEAAFSIAAHVHPQAISTDNPSRDGYGYQPNVVFDLPAGLESGIYTIEKKIPFIVKPSGLRDILVVYPANTANAYATNGGQSLYTSPRPHAVSFHRPIGIQAFSSQCLQWFPTLPERNVGYIADVDLDEYQNLNKAKLLVIIGHNEYWTRAARLNFDRYIDEGNDALILSGNTMWWQVRYSADKDRSQLICYKHWENDPVEDPLLKTFLWNDTRLHYPIVRSIGADFDKGGYGLRNDSGWDGFKIVAPESPLFEGTNLKKGDIIHCPSTEYDGAPLLGFDDEGFPILDVDGMEVVQAELLGFDKGFRGSETVGTFIVIKRSKTSGIIVNTGSTDWCSIQGMGGPGGNHIKKITLNAVTKLLNKESVFSP